MTSETKPRRIYSLQRRIQVLAATSLVVAGFILLTGTWVLRHFMYHEASAEATLNVEQLLRRIGAEPATSENVDDHVSTLRELLTKNPGAWYYYEDSDQVIRSKEKEPLYKAALTRGNSELIIDIAAPPACNQNPVEFNFDSDQGRAKVLSGGCGDDIYYIEIVGFSTDVPFIRHFLESLRRIYLSGENADRTVIPIAVVAFLSLGAITLLFGTMMKRVQLVSQAASSIGKGKHHVMLPEDDLPREILPMVQAINRALHRLEAASEQQALFVAAAAHELRTPLTIYRTRLEELEESKLKDSLVDDLRRMDSMVTQLLALARLGASELDLEKLDLTSVVRDACMDRGGAVFGAGKELEFDSSEPGVEIFGDRESVKTAVGNLIDNALMFTPEGRSVRVGVNGNRVVVSDDGPGVAETDKDRIFEPFFKNPPNKRGHGLGLAIVSEIMRIHDGEVVTYNGEERGAVFELTFAKAA